MIIKSIAVSKGLIALKAPFITALRRVDALEVIKVSIKTTCGLHAEGSASPSEAITGESTSMIYEALSGELSKALLNQRVADAFSILHKHKQRCNSAKAALDMALYALLAQKARISMSRYFSASPKPCITTARTISLNEVAIMVKEAKEAYIRGEEILKVKLGSRDGNDIERVYEISNAVPNATLLLDINQAYSLKETLHLLEAIKEIDIALLEQPVPASDLDALKEVTRISPFPVLADEAVFSYEDAVSVINSASATMINIKLMKCGGITEAIKIIELCREHGVKCMMGSMLEGPLSIYAALCIASAYPDVCRYVDLDSPLLYHAFSNETEPFTVSQNRLCFCNEGF